MRKIFNPYLAVILTTIIWGSTGVFIRYLSLPITSIAFFRAFVPAAILFVYFKVKGVKLFRADLGLILAASSIAVIEFLFYFAAYEYTSIAKALVTLYTWPIFALIFSSLLLKEQIPSRNKLLFIVSFIGVVFVYLENTASFSKRDFVGITFMLIAAALVASMIIIFKRLSARHTNFEIIFYHNFLSAIIFVPFLLLNRPLPSLHQSFIAALYALLIGLLAYIPYYFGLKHLKASTISLLSYLEVVSGILFAIVMLNETLTWNVVIGGMLITGSTLLIKK